MLFSVSFNPHKHSVEWGLLVGPVLQMRKLKQRGQVTGSRPHS